MVRAEHVHEDAHEPPAPAPAPAEGERGAREGPGPRGRGEHGEDATTGAPEHDAHDEHDTAWASHAHRDQTRARILEVALELIADQGFAATSTREISERLGFTKAALYYHFRTKEDLLAAIVAPAIAELSALVADAEASAARTPRVAPGSTAPNVRSRRELLEGYVALVARHADLIRVLSDDPAVRKSEALLGAQPLFERLVPLLAGTETPDPAQRTRAVCALGAAHSALVHAGPGDDTDVVRETAIEAACGALGIGSRRLRRVASAGSLVRARRGTDAAKGAR